MFNKNDREMNTPANTTNHILWFLQTEKKSIKYHTERQMVLILECC